MSLVLTAEPLPLVADVQGVVRVARTRVTSTTPLALATASASAPSPQPLSRKRERGLRGNACLASNALPQAGEGLKRECLPRLECPPASGKGA